MYERLQKLMNHGAPCRLIEHEIKKVLISQMDRDLELGFSVERQSQMVLWQMFVRMNTAEKDRYSLKREIRKISRQIKAKEAANG